MPKGAARVISPRGRSAARRRPPWARRASRKPRPFCASRAATSSSMFDFFLFGFYAGTFRTAFFPDRQRLRLADARFVVLRRRLSDAAAGRASSSAPISTNRPPQGPDRDAAIMASGTILIAFVPGYATIGLLAPVLVLLGPPAAGFSAGAELGGVSVYLSEMATPGQQGLLRQLAVGEPAGRDRGRGGARLRAATSLTRRSRWPPGAGAFRSSSAA